MFKRRNYIEEWLQVFPVETIYDKLNGIGNYHVWKENFLTLMNYELNHPMTVVLLQNKSIDQVIKHLTPLFIELKKDNYPSLGKWLEDILKEEEKRKREINMW